jgi:hypothetical protein
LLLVILFGFFHLESIWNADDDAYNGRKIDGGNPRGYIAKTQDPQRYTMLLEPDNPFI